MIGTFSLFSRLISRVQQFTAHYFTHENPSLPPDEAWMQQQVIQNSPFGMLLVDARQPDMPIVYVNAAFERNTGYLLSETLGKNCRFLQGTDSEQEGGRIIRRAIDKGESVVALLRNYRKDGSMFWNEVHITPVRDQMGEVTHFVGVQHDITARKEAELALARSEKRYRQMFEGNRAVKLLIDPVTGDIKDTNSAAVEFYGYTYEQLLSMRIQDINMLPADTVSAEMQRAATEERTYFEFRHRLASGEIRDVDVFSSSVDMPEGRYLYSIIVDVTGKRDGERRYRALFEQTNDAVLILDLSGNCRQVNQRAAEMLGYTFEEITELWYKDIVAPEQHAQSEAVLQRLINGEPMLPYERLFRRKDGSVFPVEVNIELVLDAEGNPKYLQSIVRDITGRKLAQEHEFALALERERTRLLTRFVHDAAHEFRTPLSVINSSAYLISRLEDAARRRDKVAQIEAQVQLLARLVDDLLMMAKLESYDSLVCLPLDVLSVLSMNCEQVRHMYGSKPRLQIELPPHLPKVLGDADYLSHAFHQILDNAFRFTPSEGMITVIAHSEHDHIYVEFCDTGVGIADEDLPHVFESFWRRDAVHTTPGFGLGLSIARRIIEQHGGTITAGNQATQGAHICVTLPIAASLR